MKSKKWYFSSRSLLFGVIFFTGILFINGANNIVAIEHIDPSGISWLPQVSYGKIALTVKGPDGNVFSKTYVKGTPVILSVTDVTGEQFPDGSYTYQLVAITEMPTRTRANKSPDKTAQMITGLDKPIRQTGHFLVKGGQILAKTASETPPDMPADIVHNDDVIIDGSLCVGNDCYSGLAFGFDTIVMMENNLRIFFDDTSTIQNYPRNDWRIICNDSTDSGGNYFAIEDATEVNNLFVLEAGAPENSLYVDSHGDVGINTSTPYYELHIVDGDSPCVRLDQDGSYGWTPQKWDICGNESNFFIRDATHASKLPFRIEPEAPTDSIFIKSNGNVGFGTGSPGYAFEVEKTGSSAVIVAERTSGAKCKIGATSNQGQFGTITSHPVKIVTNNSTVISVNVDETLTMSDGGSYNGTWNPASSRELKENFQDLSSDDAIGALEKLNPVEYNYKKHKDEKRVGFIAEDVPDLVAMNGRKTLSTVDIVAVLTKVVQEQQKMVTEQQKIVNEQQKTIDELKRRLVQLEDKGVKQ